MDSQVKDTPITRALVYSTLSVGLGTVGLHTLLGNMSMRPLHNNYGMLQSIVTNSVKEKVKDIMHKSIEAAKIHYTPESDGIYNINVIYDGSWQKRGHTSKFAIGAVIEAETGCVNDYEVISKSCELFWKKEEGKKKGEISQGECDEWFPGHKEQCSKNYEGSRGGIEAAAAVSLFNRSLEKTTKRNNNVYIHCSIRMAIVLRIILCAKGTMVKAHMMT